MGHPLTPWRALGDRPDSERKLEGAKSACIALFIDREGDHLREAEGWLFESRPDAGRVVWRRDRHQMNPLFHDRLNGWVLRKVSLIGHETQDYDDDADAALCNWTLRSTLRHV